MTTEGDWARLADRLLTENKHLKLQNDELLDTIRSTLLALNAIQSDSPSGPLAMNLAGILMHGLNKSGVQATPCRVSVQVGPDYRWQPCNNSMPCSVHCEHDMMEVTIEAAKAMRSKCRKCDLLSTQEVKRNDTPECEDSNYPCPKCKRIHG